MSGTGVEAYFDSIALIYNTYYESRTEDDRDFYRSLAVDADGPVLEVGCGTGRIHLDLLQAGVDIDGIDLSSRMLDILREQATAKGLNPDVRQADVTTFEPARKYDLVIVPFRAFLRLQTVDEQLAALKQIYRALVPGGRLVLNVFTPSFDVICEEYGEWKKENVELDGEIYTYRWKTEFSDEIQQIATVRSVLIDEDGDTVFNAGADLSLISKREFELLFRLSPFEEWSVSGGFDGGSLKSTDQEMVWSVTRQQ